MEVMAPQQSELIGREEELDRLNQVLDAAVSGNGSTLLVSGEAGLGKTRLLEEFLGTAKERGVRTLAGGALADVSQPFIVFSKALEGEVHEPLFEEHEFKSFTKIFAVNKTGILMAEASSEEADLDADIFAGMLSAVQDFVRDSFGQVGGQKAGLGRLEYGDMKILIEHGEQLFLTAVFKGMEHDDMKGLLKRSIQGMEEEHGQVLESWSGRMEEVSAIQEEVDSLAESKFFVKKNLEGVRLDNERVRISDKALESLKRLSNEGAVLVILEDLHWADESSLFVLNYIARNIGDEKILLLGTFRPDEGDVFRSALENMEGERSVEELALPKLGEESVSRLADEVYPGHAFPATLIENLSAQCEGNPLFIKEMLWQMGEEGSIVRDGEGFSLVNEDYSIPDSVQDVVGKRLGHLDAGAMALAEYVSCIGREFDDDIALSYESGKDVPTALETLKDHGIVHAKGNIMQFSHAIYQDFIYSSVEERWKRAYHKNLGEYYESAYRNNPDEVVYELARHYSRSNVFGKALDYCIKAGEKAEATYAPEQARDYYELALEALSKQPHDPEEESDVLAKLGDVDTFLGSFDAAVENLGKAHEMSKNDEFITRMMNKIAWIHLKKGDEENALEMLNGCLEIASKSNVKTQIAQAHHYFGILNIKTAEYPKALEHLEKSLAIRKDIEATEFLPETYIVLGMLFSRTGEVDKAIKNYQDGVDIADQVGDKERLANALGNLGIVHWYEGNMDTALDYFLRSLEIRKTIRDKSGTGISYDNIAGIYGIQGNLEKSIEYYERGIGIFRQTGEKIFLANLLSNASLHYLQNDDLDNALDRAEESLGLMLVTGNKRGEVLALVNLVNINIKRGDTDKALEQAEMALNLAQEVSLNREFGLVHTVLGSAYCSKEDWERSRTEFEKAVELFKEFEDALSEATLHYEYGLMLSAGNNPNRNPTEAREHLEKALKEFERGGMKLWVEKCRLALEGLDE